MRRGRNLSVEAGNGVGHHHIALVGQCFASTCLIFKDIDAKIRNAGARMVLFHPCFQIALVRSIRLRLL